MNFILLQNEMLNKFFNSNNWYNDKTNNNDLYTINYRKNKIKNEYFEIKIVDTKLIVSIPIKNSIYQYQTTFNDCKDAISYLDKYIKYYENDDIDLELGFGD
jgi:hypothetical protein